MTRTCVLQRGRPRCSRPPAGSPRRRHVRSGQRCQFQPDPFTLFDQRLQRAAFPGLRRVHTDGLGRLRERGGGALKRRRGRRSCVGGKRAEGVPDSAPLSARSLARATATRACRPCADRVTGTRFSECLSARLSGRLVARIREADARLKLRSEGRSAGRLLLPCGGLSAESAARPRSRCNRSSALMLGRGCDASRSRVEVVIISTSRCCAASLEEGGVLPAQRG